MPNNHTISQRKYDAANCRFYSLKLNLRTDADVIAKLDAVPSRQDYIRQLVRNDLASGSSIVPDTKHDKK